MIFPLLTSILACMIFTPVLPAFADFCVFFLKYWNFNKGHPLLLDKNNMQKIPPVKSYVENTTIIISSLMG